MLVSESQREWSLRETRRHTVPLFYPVQVEDRTGDLLVLVELSEGHNLYAGCR